MRILTIFTQAIENNTSSMIRCRNVINGLATIGNHITVYSPFPDKNSIYYGEEFRINPGIEVRRYGKKTNYNMDKKGQNKKKNGIILRIYRKFDLFGSAIIYIKYTNDIIKKIEFEEYDMVISFSSPVATHIISNKIVTRKGEIKYIQQWGDPLVADITRKSLTPKWVQHIIESNLIHLADKVYYVSPFTLQEQKKLFPKYKDKMEFVPTPAEKRLYEETYNKKLRIGYFGSYQTSARNIIPLYKAVKSNKEIELLIVGDSDINLQETDNIRLIDRTTPDHIDELMKQMDVIVCLMNSSGGQIPGKIYNYACTNKEILMVIDGDQGEAIRMFLERYERFTFVKNNADSITNQLQRYVDEGVVARQPVNEFTPAIIAEKMVQL